MNPSKALVSPRGPTLNGQYPQQNVIRSIFKENIASNAGVSSAKNASSQPI